MGFLSQPKDIVKRELAAEGAEAGGLYRYTLLPFIYSMQREGAVFVTGKAGSAKKEKEKELSTKGWWRTVTGFNRVIHEGTRRKTKTH